MQGSLQQQYGCLLVSGRSLATMSTGHTSGNQLNPPLAWHVSLLLPPPPARGREGRGASWDTSSDSDPSCAFSSSDPDDVPSSSRL
jgi:hypothetical protein